MKYIFDMSKSHLDILRSPAQFAGMGRVLHSWAGRIAPLPDVRLMAAIPPRLIRQVQDLVESFRWMARHAPIHGTEDAIQSAAAGILLKLRKKNRAGLLGRKMRGLAYRAFDSRHGRQLVAALHAQRDLAPRFVYHNPLTAALPRDLPDSCIPVVSIYDIMPFVFRDTYPDSVRQAFTKSVESISRHKAHVIVNSEDTKHSLICFFGIPSSRIHVVPLGSDPSWGPGEGTLPAAVCGPFALYVAGSNQRRKNLANTVTGFRKFTEISGESAQLVIVGSGTEEFQAEADSLAGDGGAAVCCLGAVDEGTLGELYSRAKVGLYTSLYEGFGLPVLECMAKGLPIVCGNRTSLPEAAGDAATLVEASDPAAIGIGLAKLWQNGTLRDSKSEEGLRRSQQMSWDASSKALLNAYEIILNA